MQTQAFIQPHFWLRSKSEQKGRGANKTQESDRKPECLESFANLGSCFGNTEEKTSDPIFCRSVVCPEWIFPFSHNKSRTTGSDFVHVLVPVVKSSRGFDV